MTALAKRAGALLATDVDAYDLATTVRQVDVVLDSGDRDIARLLATRIVKASRAGEWGFDATKLGQLVVLAGELTKVATDEGCDRKALRKAADALKGGDPASASEWPPDLLAKAQSLIVGIEGADTPSAQETAVRAAQGFIADIEARRALGKALSSPRTMGVSGCAAV